MLFKNLALPGDRIPMRRVCTRRRIIFLSAVLFLCLIVPILYHQRSDTWKKEKKYKPSNIPKKDTLQEKRLSLAPLGSNEIRNLRVLMVGPHGGIDFCETLMTASILGYPVPTLIDWDASDPASDDPRSLDQTEAKFDGVHKWLSSRPVAASNDLVLVVNSNDIWFQLGPEVLLKRYHAVVALANRNLKERLGKAVDIEGLKQSIVFGSSKVCAPNEPFSVACYAIPESPLPEDMYGQNTDTVMGKDRFASQRQRYLDSGYIMGTVADVRALFQRAVQKVGSKTLPIPSPDWSEDALSLYGGTYQTILHEIFGEQEYQREVIRRRNLGVGAYTGGRKSKPTWIDGTLVDDILNPSFTHQKIEEKPGKPDEFGITVDYWSDLGHQTAHSGGDTRWIAYNEPIGPQVSQRGTFDCPAHVTGTLPRDTLNTSLPTGAVAEAFSFTPNAGWDQIALLTNLCLDTIPVMLHMNEGGANRRSSLWSKMWMQPLGRRLMDGAIMQSGGHGTKGAKGGAWTPSGDYLAWEKLCPASLEPDLFRDPADEV